METPWGREDTLTEYRESDQHPEWLETKVHRLTQLVLRQEQTLASLRQDMVMHLFMKNGKSGMIPVLCDAANKWRATKEEEPTKLSYSLKLALFKQLLIMLHERLGETSQKEEAMTHAKSLGWVDAEMNWQTLRWNPGQQALEVDSSVRAAPTKDLLSQLVLMRKGATEETILRFRSLRHGGQSGMDSVPAGGISQARGSSSLVDPSRMDWECGVACARLQIEEGSSSIRFPRQRDLELPVSAKLGLARLLKLSLSNPTNLCYLNSTLIALSWALLQAQLCGTLQQALVPAISFLTQEPKLPHGRSVQVLSHLPLLAKMQAWSRLHVQHDAELIAYLLPRLNQPGFQGSWEARRHIDANTCATDGGTTLAPIVLALNAGEQLILQTMIDQWHAQASIHALTHPTILICLQIQRFIWEAGDMRRDYRSLLGYHCTVHMPVYDGPDTTTVHIMPYQVVAMQLHYGEQPTTGHYRTAMLGQIRFGKDRVWLSDDGCTPAPIQREHDSAIYLLWLMQASAL